MKKLGANLYFGCFGFSHNDFCVCSGAENIILDLELIDDEKYAQLLFFLEMTCRLFEKQVLGNVTSGNVLNLLQKNFLIFSEAELENIQIFLKQHRVCGSLYIDLRLK